MGIIHFFHKERRSMRKASVPGGGTDAFLWGKLCLGDRCNEIFSILQQSCLKGQTLIQNKPSISESYCSASLEEALFCGLSWISFFL